MRLVAGQGELAAEGTQAEFLDAPATEIGVTENVVDFYICSAEYYEITL